MKRIDTSNVLITAPLEPQQERRNRAFRAIDPMLKGILAGIVQDYAVGYHTDIYTQKLFDNDPIHKTISWETPKISPSRIPNLAFSLVVKFMMDRTPIYSTIYYKLEVGWEGLSEIDDETLTFLETLAKNIESCTRLVTIIKKST